VNKIKIVGILIFSTSIILAILSIYISKQNKINNDLLNAVNTQKAFTQETSKTIFYLYKNHNSSHQELDKSIKQFINIMNIQNTQLVTISNQEFLKQNKKIIKIWNEFYFYVQKFRDQSKTTTTYSNILLEKTVNTIYKKNLMLIVELDKLIEINKAQLYLSIDAFKNIQYVLFAVLVLLLIYLFTQVKLIISFIQKFLQTSQNIIINSSIKDLEQIQVKNNTADVLEATNNFNILVKNIDISIESSSNLIEHSCKSLELVEQNIEDLLDLLNAMDENNEFDKNLAKKEDAIIQSLEELSTSSQSLQALKNDLQQLISHHNLKNS